MNQYEQIYLNVSRQNIASTIDYYYSQGYLCIQTADLTDRKVLMTFERCVKPTETTKQMFTAKKVEEK